MVTYKSGRFCLHASSSEAVASTSTGKMAVNYSRHLHPQVNNVSVIVMSCLCLLIAYFSSQTLLFDDPSIRMELLEEIDHISLNFLHKATKLLHNSLSIIINDVTNL